MEVRIRLKKTRADLKFPPKCQASGQREKKQDANVKQVAVLIIIDLKATLFNKLIILRNLPNATHRNMSWIR